MPLKFQLRQTVQILYNTDGCDFSQLYILLSILQKKSTKYMWQNFPGLFSLKFHAYSTQN